jgi:hypothetical protein
MKKQLNAPMRSTMATARSKPGSRTWLIAISVS